MRVSTQFGPVVEVVTAVACACPQRLTLDPKPETPNWVITAVACTCPGRNPRDLELLIDAAVPRCHVHGICLSRVGLRIHGREAAQHGSEIEVTPKE